MKDSLKNSAHSFNLVNKEVCECTCDRTNVVGRKIVITSGIIEKKFARLCYRGILDRESGKHHSRN